MLHFRYLALETLDLDKNTIRTTDMSGMERISTLVKLILDDNKLEEIPISVMATASLTHLSMGGNAIASIPPDFAKLTVPLAQMITLASQLDILMPNYLECYRTSRGSALSERA